ncbi:hypothetical protein CA13_63150 [Planctomycetes bacterium CA13]|uniref:Lipocalin-like domain-containing protein n=1 Tax=Novipirellula herctigrandis TaxID=2527986 RepID=A0A5C5ZBY9_9BACT|nr:hypothetical protein CA13_63150 [Planctomycetes bacterium CA13]
MKKIHPPCVLRYRLISVTSLLMMVLVTAAPCYADDSTIFKIEEVWELVVNEPDAASNSPQITFFISPNVGLENCYFQLQMNYAADDQFSGGGFHVGAFNDGQMKDQARSVTRRVLATSGDVIRWTSVMAVID